MNKAQKIITSLGLLIVIGICLRPPYQSQYGSGFIFSNTYRIDWERLGLYVTLVIIVISFLAFGIFGRTKKHDLRRTKKHDLKSKEESDTESVRLTHPTIPELNGQNSAKFSRAVRQAMAEKPLQIYWRAEALTVQARNAAREGDLEMANKHRDAIITLLEGNTATSAALRKKEAKENNRATKKYQQYQSAIPKLTQQKETIDEFSRVVERL